MSGPIRGAGRFRFAFFDPETTYASPAEQYPVAADAIRLVSGSFNIKRPTVARADANGTAGKDGAIKQKGTIEGQMELYLLASGTAGTAPDWDDLLVYGGGFTKITGSDTTVSGGSSTTTSVDVTDASGFSVGGVVTISGETRVITAVDTASTPGNITVTPALSSAPADTTTLTAGIAWEPNSDSDSTPASGTVWLGNNAHMARITGATFTSVRFAFGGGEAARLTCSYTASTASFLYTGALNGSINNSVTTITVANGDIVPDDVSTANPYYFYIDKDDPTKDEVVRVTAKAGNDLTVVRDGLGTTGAHSHDDGAIIEPYYPAGTFAGDPVPATDGGIILGSVTEAAETGSWECDMGRQMVENQHGTSWVNASYVNGMRTVTAQFESYGQNSIGAVFVDAIEQGSTEAFLQQGDTTGSIVGGYSPAVYFEVPDNALGEEYTRWTFSGEARVGTVGSDDECRFFHG